MKRRMLSLLLIFSMLTGVLSLSGCGKTEQNQMTRGDLLDMLCDEFGMYDYEQETPYLDSVPVDDPYFASVQKCVEWGILPADDLTYDVYAPATRGELAELAVNAGRLTDEADSTESKLACAAELELVESGRNGKIDENRKITREEARAALSTAQEIWADPNYEEYLEYELHNGVTEIGVNENITYPAVEDGLLLPADKAAGLTEGSIYLARDAYGFVQAHRVGALEVTGEGVLVTNRDEGLDIEDVFETIQYQESSTPDFSNSIVTDGGGNVLTADGTGASGVLFSETDEPAQAHFLGAGVQARQIGQTGGMGGRSLEFTVDGVKIKGSISGDSIAFSAKGKINDEMSFSASYELSDFKFDQKVDFSRGQLNYARLKLDYTAKNTLKFEAKLSATSVDNPGAFSSTTDYKSALMGVINDVAYDNSVSGFNYDGMHAKGCSKSIGIARIAIPGVHYGVAGLVLEIKLEVSLTGSIELSVQIANPNGIEYQRGAGVRVIKGNDIAADLKLQVSLEFLIYAGLVASFCGFNVADFGAKAGIGGSVSSTVHLADYTIAGELGIERAAVNTELPGDFMEAVARTRLGGTMKIETCSDARADAILRISVGSNSIIGKIVSWEHEIFGPKSGKLWSKAWHIEDGIFVEECTRQYRMKEDAANNGEGSASEKNRAGSTDPDKLDLTSYVITLSGAPQRMELALEAGEPAPQVVWVSENDRIASVDQTGLVAPVSTGVTVVIGYLKNDPSVSVRCTVIVQEIGKENWEFLPANMACRV